MAEIQERAVAMAHEGVRDDAVRAFVRLCGRGTEAMAAAECLLRANTSAMAAAEECGSQFVATVQVAQAVAVAAQAAGRLAALVGSASPPPAQMTTGVLPAGGSFEMAAQGLGALAGLHGATGTDQLSRLGKWVGLAAGRAVMPGPGQGMGG